MLWGLASGQEQSALVQVAKEPWGDVFLEDIPRHLSPGETLRLRLRFVLEDGGHLQVAGTESVGLLAPPGGSMGPLELPEPEPIDNGEFEPIGILRGTFDAFLPIRLPEDLSAGSLCRLDGRLRFRGGTEEEIYLPVTRRFEIDLPVRVSDHSLSPAEDPTDHRWILGVGLVSLGLGAAAWTLWRSRRSSR
ncbi:MAG: hypothetical protein RL885_10065 [Planctomycetota bacterium]